MRHFLNVTLFAAMLCTLFVVSTLAQVFPSRTIFIVVPYPAGGSTDVLARALGNELSKLWASRWWSRTSAVQARSLAPTGSPTRPPTATCYC